jgi:hypothetical protein
MSIYHKDLASGRWFKFSLVEQLANIGSDVIRAIQWKNKGNQEYSKQAFERALELIDLTVADPKNKKRLREILRAREALVDYLVYDNEYGSNDESWRNYFYNFNYASAVQRGR